jgi:hypothetical protein
VRENGKSNASISFSFQKANVYRNFTNLVLSHRYKAESLHPFLQLRRIQSVGLLSPWHIALAELAPKSKMNFASINLNQIKNSVTPNVLQRKEGEKFGHYRERNREEESNHTSASVGM